ncbi:FAD-dependent oxidoreductase [Myceligenerans halotolerans]
MSLRITVVGAGVVGLSIAHELASAGHHVTVVADAATADTVSAVSAALWFPYRSERSARVEQLLQRSLVRFTQMVEVREASVELRTGIVVERVPNPDRSWMRLLPDAAPAAPDQLPPGALSGVLATVPFIMIPQYLPWLLARTSELGVRFIRCRIADLAELRDTTDVAVIAAGIRGGELLGDDPTMYPVRGQIARLANPGLRDWITDESNPDGLTYVFPRRDDVVIGGVAIEGSWDTAVRADIQRAMIVRAQRLVPALAGQPVLGAAAGIRPARRTVRIESVLGHALPVIAAYGHGGAGVTLSWGTAEAVAELVSNLR